MAQTKIPAKLTIPRATSQARRHVDKIMPGALATVDSRGSWDLDTDRQLVITTVTFPAGHAGGVLLAMALGTLAGNVRQINADSSIVITREV